MAKSVKQSNKTASKPVRKRRSKSQRRLKAVSRKISRSRKQLKRIVRRQNRQFQRRVQRTKKRLFTKNTAKRTRKSTRKPATQAKTAKNKAKKPARPQAQTPATYPFRLLLMLMLISAVAGLLAGHQLRGHGYADFLGSSKKTEAPGRITSYGPRQSDSQFSTYPTWAQDFASAGDGQPDPRYWNIFQGQPPNDNQEAQYYTADHKNVYIGHGALTLKATHESQPKGYQYASGRIDTEGKLSFLYGRIDVTAKLPSGVGTWPAIWLLPNNTKYQDLGSSSDPIRYINGGEMDMMEAVGFNPDIVYGVVHTRTDLKNPDRIGAFNQVTVPGNNTGYNRYTMLWTPSTITYEVNDTPFFTYTRQAGSDYTTWPFDQPFYLILNLAMGGNWGGEDMAQFPGNGIDNSALPASLDIKSIYYYTYIGSQAK